MGAGVLQPPAEPGFARRSVRAAEGAATTLEMRTADVVIVGGGIIGLSVAYHLVKRQPLQVIVLEKEAEIGTGATARATGAIRHQFSTAVNVRLTQLSYPAYLRFAAEMEQEIGLRVHGYLMITTQAGAWEAMQASARLQQSLGVPTRLVTPPEAGEIFPGLRTDDLIGGTYCHVDASGNPSDAAQGYSFQARRRGVEIRREEQVVGIDVAGGRVTAVRTDKETYRTPVVVDAAGPHVREIAAMAGVDLPARPFRRQVFICDPPADMPREIPFTVDMDTGWYVHAEKSGTLLLAGTDKDNRPGIEPEVDWSGLDRVAEAAWKRVPLLQEMKLRSAYCGVRTLTPDYHAIVGRVPDVAGFICATACNGHGFMHAPAVGLLLAEEILDGAAHSLDISPLAITRFQGEVPAEANMF